MTDNAARDVIAEYQSAYREVRNGAEPPEIKRRGSWYQVSLHGSGWSYRLREITAMTQRLRAELSHTPKEQPDAEAK